MYLNTTDNRLLPIFQLDMRCETAEGSCDFFFIWDSWDDPFFEPTITAAHFNVHFDGSVDFFFCFLFLLFLSSIYTLAAACRNMIFFTQISHRQYV